MIGLEEIAIVLTAEVLEVWRDRMAGMLPHEYDSV